MQLLLATFYRLTFEITIGVRLGSLAAELTGLIHLLLGRFLAVVAHLLRLFGIGLYDCV